MDVGEDLRAIIALLLTFRWQSLDGGELEGQAGGLIGVAADGDVMTTRPRCSVELSEDAIVRIRLRCVGRWFGQPIGLHAQQEAGAQILRETEELVDVALPVRDVHAALRADDS
jgi:hypothetical protein